MKRSNGCVQAPDALFVVKRSPVDGRFHVVPTGEPHHLAESCPLCDPEMRTDSGAEVFVHRSLDGREGLVLALQALAP